MSIRYKKMGMNSSYIRGFFDGEGTIDTKRKLLDITNTNLFILQQIQLFLLSHAISARIRKHSMSPVSRRPCFRFVLTGFHKILGFKRLIGSLDKSKQRKLEQLVFSYRYSPLSEHYISKIRELRSTGLTFKRIAQVMHRNKSSVWAAYSRSSKGSA